MNFSSSNFSKLALLTTCLLIQAGCGKVMSVKAPATTGPQGNPVPGSPAAASVGNNGTGNSLEFATGQVAVPFTAAATSASVTSATPFTAPSSRNWSVFAWAPARPYSKGLPDNKQRETAYSAGNADMAGNSLLMHFDESIDSSTFADSSASGNTLSCNGASCPVPGAPGRIGSAASFNINSSLAVSGPSIKIKPQVTGLTMETWIYLSATPLANQFIIRNDSGCGFNLYFETPTKLRSADNCGNGASFTHTLTVGKWYHVAVTVTAAPSQMESLFINGALVGSRVASSAAWTSVNTWSALNIGATVAGTGFAGSLDELAIYNRVLPDADFAAHFRRGALRMRFQLRSCPATGCTTEPFVGPQGLNSYFSEVDNHTVGLPIYSTGSLLPSNPLLQYRFVAESDITPEVPQLFDIKVKGNDP